MFLYKQQEKKPNLISFSIFEKLKEILGSILNSTISVLSTILFLCKFIDVLINATQQNLSDKNLEVDQKFLQLYLKYIQLFLHLKLIF